MAAERLHSKEANDWSFALAVQKILFPKQLYQMQSCHVRVRKTEINIEQVEPPGVSG